MRHIAYNLKTGRECVNIVNALQVLEHKDKMLKRYKYKVLNPSKYKYATLDGRHITRILVSPTLNRIVIYTL